MRRCKGKKWERPTKFRQSEQIQYLWINFSILYGCGSWCPKTVNSNIKISWSQIKVTNIIMETFEILLELPKCDTANAVGKTELIDLVDTRFATEFQFVKIMVSSKSSEKRSAYIFGKDT